MRRLLLRDVHKKLNVLIQLSMQTLRRTMKLEELVSALNDDTNAVAARIDKLTADLAAAVAEGQAPAQSTLDQLQAVSDRLKALGQDPSNPVPVPAPEPAPTA